MHEGQFVKVYPTNEDEKLIFHFKDNFPGAQNTQEKEIKGKGSYDNEICIKLLRYLESYHVPTHFIETYKPNEMLVKRLDMLPIQVIIWNFLTDELSKRFGIKKTGVLGCAIVEYALKNKDLRYPTITADHACAFELATSDEMHTIDRTARKINAVLKSFFDRREYKLVHLVMEFGRSGRQILLGGRLTPDTVSLWDMRIAGQKTMDPLRPETMPLEEAYEVLKNRICA